MRKLLKIFLLIAVVHYSASIHLNDLSPAEKQALQQELINEQNGTVDFQQKSKPKKNRRNLSIVDTYTDVINYIPKQLGITYDDEADKDISTVGNTMLGYGAYNLMDRKKSFRKLKQQLEAGIASRNLYIQALDRQLGMIKSVVDAVDSNIKTINTRTQTLEEEIGAAASENNFWIKVEY